MQTSKYLTLTSILNRAVSVKALIKSNMLTWKCLSKNKGASYVTLA
ncbi:hypothetical protein Aasi_1066 [Candidatus Amoebophilus asiaticus 5a2]|uniref:Uncharacterized protein n=1 Tax=Amoebophilus asiaticus (strain 5a2) TaxID=452471 RepID=B3ET59_AMOA5|nr:hypothetical protein [Candidatus Amoebophilus asiaticus]ACE06411.1 hypothetical protein Aasi_1066 [Candidatus Amoebophilus asiaticus 5a2]